MEFELPDLTSAKRIGLDTETKDPDLKTHGSAVRRGGYMVGISVATDDKHSWYIPFRHEQGFNFDPDKVKQWALDNFCNPNQPKVGANLRYDLDYLFEWGVPVSGPFLDVQNAEPLIDEQKRTYSLNSLAKTYLGEAKVEYEIDQYSAEHFGKRADPKEHLWEMPSELVAKYAEADASLALRIFEQQEKTLSKLGLEKVFEMETKLIPMILAMKARGVRIDVKSALKLDKRFKKELVQAQEKLNTIAGFEVNYNAGASIGKACDMLGYDYPLTEKTKAPSFTKDWLEEREEPLFKYISELRKAKKFGGTFIQGVVLKYLVGDRIHCDFNQLRSDDKGTVSGRFSSSNPNLQFIPKRDKVIGPLIRGLFLPDDDDSDWVSLDYKAVEPRITLHYASRRLAQHFYDTLNANPDMDLYQPMIDRLPQLDRKTIKEIDLGLCYGMGKVKMANKLNLTIERTEQLIAEYHAGVPYVQELSERAKKMAEKKGVITTLMGRRRNFTKWECNDMGDDEKPLDHINAIGKWGRHNIRRAYTYKALNSLIQGSAADVMKKAMIDVWESGICDEIGVPALTVHDELDYSIPRGGKQKGYIAELKNIMESSFKLRVPLTVDVQVGKTWGVSCG